MGLGCVALDSRNRYHVLVCLLSTTSTSTQRDYYIRNRPFNAAWSASRKVNKQRTRS